MDYISCQYCNAEVSMVEVEKESGICPECGSMISGSTLFDTVEEDVFDDVDDLLDDGDDDFVDDDLPEDDDDF